MHNQNFMDSLFARGNSYWLTRFLILRLLGFVYAVAFLVAAQQLVPLVGERGLTPATHFSSGDSITTRLARGRGNANAESVLARHFRSRLIDFFLIGFCLSLVVLAGYANAIILAVCGSSTCRSSISARFGNTPNGWEIQDPGPNRSSRFFLSAYEAIHSPALPAAASNSLASDLAWIRYAGRRS